MTNTISKMLGVDDWLIFAYVNGVLSYTICEVWPVWLDTPHKVNAEFRSEADCEDWRVVLEWAEQNKHDLYWREAGFTDTDGTYCETDPSLLWNPS